MLLMRTILHPTDFSVHSEHAFRMACSLARDHGARLVVLHVVPSLQTGEIVWSALLQSEDYRGELERQLRTVAPADLELHPDYRLEDGDPAAQILRVAEETKCELIVMGTHGRTGLGRLLLGSVAEEVVRKAPCAVLTMKAPLPNAIPVGELSSNSPANVGRQ
jgi:nucleotide-binding universal stress UspA family protein